MAVFHGVGLFFEWSDRTGRLASFKVRDVDRLTYVQLLPRVLFNQIFVLLPAMVAFQYAGLAFTGAPHLGALHFVAGMLLMGVGHDIVQYVFHRFVLHQAWLDPQARAQHSSFDRRQQSHQRLLHEPGGFFP